MVQTALIHWIKLLPKEKGPYSLDKWDELHKWYEDGNEIVSEISGASVTLQAVNLCDVVDWLQNHREKVLEILDGKYS